MRRLVNLLLWPFRAAFICGTLGLTAFAIAAILGAVHPGLDFFNHLQPILLAGSLACLVISPLLLTSVRWRAFNLAVAATGLFASAVAIVPEAVSAFDPLPDAPTDGAPIYKIYSHNLFGLNEDAERAMAAINAESPDIILFQEYFYDMRNALDPMLEEKYPYSAICVGGRRENIAIYANIPFEADKWGCERGDSSRIARIIGHFKGTDGTEFSVLTTHIDWPISLLPLRQAKNIMEGVNGIFARQHEEFADLEEALTKIPGPLIVAGDFNATSWSYAIESLEATGGLQRHTRNLLTYPTLFYIFGWRPTLPFLPLDQVLSRGGVTFHEIRAVDAAGSDHLGVVGRFSIDPEATANP